MKGFSKIFLFSAVIIALLLTGCFSDNNQPVSSSTGQEVPNSPSPINGAVNQSRNLTLRWECQGAEYYDIYWGQGDANLKIASGIKEKFYPRPTHAYNSVFYWYVVAHFADGREPVKGPIWKYTTEAQSGSTPTNNGFILTAYRVKEFLPAYVNVLFQVQDAKGKGVSGLKLNDFTIYDDYEALAFQEHTQLVDASPSQLKIYTTLVLDNSTSLTGKIDRIRKEADQFLQGLLLPSNSTHYVAIYSFSADVKRLTPLTPNFTNDYTNDVIPALNAYQLGAMSTDLYGAVVAGAENMVDVTSADSIRQSFLVLFTDGKDTQGSTPYVSAKNATNFKKVYTVGFDDGPVDGLSYDPAVLQDLGSAGFFSVGNTDSLTIVFKTISDEIKEFSNSFYSLNYLSPREGPNNHVIRIEKTINPIISFIQENYNSSNFFHPEVNKASLFIVDLSTMDWVAAGETYKVYDGTHSFQAVTYLGQSFPSAYSIEPKSQVVIDKYDETNSKFYTNSVPLTISVYDSSNSYIGKQNFIIQRK